MGGTREAGKENWTACEALGRHQGGRKGSFEQPGRHQGGTRQSCATRRPLLSILCVRLPRSVLGFRVTYSRASSTACQGTGVPAGLSAPGCLRCARPLAQAPPCPDSGLRQRSGARIGRRPRFSLGFRVLGRLGRVAADAHMRRWHHPLFFKIEGVVASERLPVYRCRSFSTPQDLWR